MKNQKIKDNKKYSNVNNINSQITRLEKDKPTIHKKLVNLVTAWAKSRKNVEIKIESGKFEEFDLKEFYSCVNSLKSELLSNQMILKTYKIDFEPMINLLNKEIEFCELTAKRNKILLDIVSLYKHDKLNTETPINDNDLIDVNKEFKNEK